MSPCGNGCRDCGVKLGDRQQFARFSPKIVAKAMQAIAALLVEKGAKEFLDQERTIIRCDGDVLLCLTDRPLTTSESAQDKSDAVQDTFCYLIILLSEYREACRNRAQVEGEQSYESFSLQLLVKAISLFARDLRHEPKLSYKDCMWRFEEALEIHICWDIYWDNSLKNLDHS